MQAVDKERRILRPLHPAVIANEPGPVLHGETSMPDIKKVIENPDTPSPRRADREIDLQEWDEAQGRRLAGDEGIELTDAHWEVIRYLRDYYLEHGPPESGREMSDALDDRFAERGGRKYLRRLFPQGPVAQGMHIAGLQVPAYTEDEGFGISR
jgi:tRNA 2-thiouridine synthesizing protein E